ncbi:MAG: hypothetical protein QXU32_12365 [Nitrososphaerales archaeon]
MYCYKVMEERPKPVREEVYLLKLLFQNTDFSFIDRIVDPDREREEAWSKGLSSKCSIHGITANVPEEYEQHAGANTLP